MGVTPDPFLLWLDRLHPVALHRQVHQRLVTPARPATDCPVVISGGPGMAKPEVLGAGKVIAIVFGCFAGCMAISYAFFMPYFYRR